MSSTFFPNNVSRMLAKLTEANNARLSSQDGCDADDCHDDDDDDECAPNGGLDNEEDDQEDDQDPVMGGNTATEEAPPREEKTSDIVSGHFEVKRNKFVFCCSVCRKEVASEFEARAKRNMKDVHFEKFSIRSLEDFFSKRARPEDVAQGKCKLLPQAKVGVWDGWREWSE